MGCNRLARETSPYLLQHKNNPVDWQPWDEQALADARARNKPILLSVGYTACHWCHVMARESFENIETALIMNELYINIKVDREERPDIDQLYQRALSVLGEQGGWPLTMFLATDTTPLWGGTYFPPKPRFGKPAFRDVLISVAKSYSSQEQILLNNAVLMRKTLEHWPSTSIEKNGDISLSSILLDRAALTLVNYVDYTYGGLQGVPKFPQFTLFNFLWKTWRRIQEPRLATAVQLTLECICQGGIYDHLGGGMARYSTDDTWLVPHFEKMLYDNALLIELLTTVWQDTRKDLFRLRVEEVINWVAREMTAESGAFFTSLGADSDGDEGKYYTWSADEIKAVLGQDATPFCQCYGVTQTGQWRGRNILHRLQSGDENATLDQLLYDCRMRLLERKYNTRTKPVKDDKILADWNGLMIQSLAWAGTVFGRPIWIAMAVRAFSTICNNMTLSDGRLCHSSRHGRVQDFTVLDDYANMSLAALSLFDATHDKSYLEKARFWVAITDNLYWDTSNNTGGYFFTSSETTDLVSRIKTPADSATPAGNGTMAHVLAKLYYITAIDEYRIRSTAVIRAFSKSLLDQSPTTATLMNAMECLCMATIITIVSNKQEKIDSWCNYIVTIPISNLILRIGSPDLNMNTDCMGPETTEEITAYICHGQTCLTPVTTISELDLAISTLQQLSKEERFI